MFLLVLGTYVYAGHSSVEGGTISNIKIHNTTGTPVLMFSTNPYLEPPTCNANPAIEWAVKLDDFGKSVYSLILSAHAQGKKVFVHGDHRCDDWSDRESIFHITIVN